MSYVCPSHGGFPTKSELMNHMKMDHKVDPDSIQGFDDVIPPQIQTSDKIRRNLDENPVMPPPVMNPDLVKALEDQRKNEKETPETLVANPVIPVELKPLRLEYRWSGQCPECHSEPSTIMLEATKGTYAVCYCISCNKQLLNRKVEPLTGGGKV